VIVKLKGPVGAEDLAVKAKSTIMLLCAAMVPVALCVNEPSEEGAVLETVSDAVGLSPSFFNST